jgi:hypothetical protein
MSITTARLIGLAGTEIYTGRWTLDQAFDYVIQNSEVDGDTLDDVRERLKQYAHEDHQ